MNKLLWILYFAIYFDINCIFSLEYESYYPDTVSKISIRKDVDGNEVATGKMNLVGGVPHHIQAFRRHPEDVMVSLATFKKSLQCAASEPSLDEYTGAINLLKLMPPSKLTVELMCAWAETHCEPWDKCHEVAEEFKSGKFPANFGMNHYDGFQSFRLLHIMNGSIYYDWPWGIDRIKDVGSWKSFTSESPSIIELLLSKINDFPDVFFFFGGERPYFPWNFPFPAFANAPSLTHNNIPWPWLEEFRTELGIYQKLFPDQIQNQQGPVPRRTSSNTDLASSSTQTKIDTTIDDLSTLLEHTRSNQTKSHDSTRGSRPSLRRHTTGTGTNTATTGNPPTTDITTSQTYLEMTKQLPWGERTPKAAFYGSCDEYRQILFDQGRVANDRLDIHFHFHLYCTLTPTNPQSKESALTHESFAHMKPDEIENAKTSNPPGYVLPLASLANRRAIPYHPGHYKYVIVTMGSHALSTSGRLGGLIAHSGAVILLQRHSFFYHFSARLQPWVHYVPISYSMADIAEKIAWLQAHDEIAQQLAENARVFGRSFLRLEDHYCYAATSLETIAHAIKPGEAVGKPFTPVKLFDGELRPNIPPPRDVLMDY